jgi:hypothetical protein
MKIAIYARVSTTDQNCERQLNELREYAGRRGWDIAGEYVDTGWSGAKTSRPQLDKLMADARQRRFDTVIVWALDASQLLPRSSDRSRPRRPQDLYTCTRTTPGRPITRAYESTEAAGAMVAEWSGMGPAELSNHVREATSNSRWWRASHSRSQIPLATTVSLSTTAACRQNFRSRHSAWARQCAGRLAGALGIAQPHRMRAGPAPAIR